MTAPIILVLRPEPGNRETCARIKALGLEPVSLPIFEAHQVEWRAPNAGEFDAILLTSANAVRFAGPQMDAFVHRPAYCVGPATAQAARAAGLQAVFTGGANLPALLAEYEPRLSGARILHLCGADYIQNESHKFNITHCIIYKMIETQPQFPAIAQNTGAIALIHSPRASARFRELLERQSIDHCGISLICISPAAATSAGDGWQRVAVAAEPREDALLASLHQLIFGN